MAEQQTDYSQIYDFLYRIDRRVGYLEKDATYIGQKIDTLDSNKTRDFNALAEELKDIRSNIADIKTHFSKCIHEMTSLSKELKNVIKKEELQGLNSQVDEIKFEEYVTHRDLDRGM